MSQLILQLAVRLNYSWNVYRVRLRRLVSGTGKYLFTGNTVIERERRKLVEAMSNDRKVQLATIFNYPSSFYLNWRCQQDSFPSKRFVCPICARRTNTHTHTHTTCARIYTRKCICGAMKGVWWPHRVAKNFVQAY